MASGDSVNESSASNQALQMEDRSLCHTFLCLCIQLLPSLCVTTRPYIFFLAVFSLPPQRTSLHGSADDRHQPSVKPRAAVGHRFRHGAVSGRTPPPSPPPPAHLHPEGHHPPRPPRLRRNPPLPHRRARPRLPRPRRAPHEPYLGAGGGGRFLSDGRGGAGVRFRGRGGSRRRMGLPVHEGVAPSGLRPRGLRPQKDRRDDQPRRGQSPRVRRLLEEPHQRRGAGGVISVLRT